MTVLAWNYQWVDGRDRVEVRLAIQLPVAAERCRIERRVVDSQHSNYRRGWCDREAQQVPVVTHAAGDALTLDFSLPPNAVTLVDGHWGPASAYSSVT